MNASQPLILIVDDEAPIRKFLLATLGAHDFRCVEATTAQEALVRAASQPPDLVLLDLGLPDGDGLSVIRELRQWTTTPILVLSARGQEQDKVAALESGADDYLTKPFGVAELIARIRVALRHASRPAGDRGESMVRIGDDVAGFRVDLARRVVTVVRDGVEGEVRLTPTEYRLVSELVKHVGKVLPHAHLLREVWGPPHTHDVAYLRVYMGQLRQKLEPEPARPRWLLTESGVGYRLVG